MAKENKKKLNLSFTPDIIEYLQTESENYGMSISAYLTMLVSNHRKENFALESMQNIGGIMEQLEKLLEENKKINQPSEIKASDTNVDPIAQS